MTLTTTHRHLHALVPALMFAGGILSTVRDWLAMTAAMFGLPALLALVFVAMGAG